MILLYQRDVTGLFTEELEENAARDGDPLDPFARVLAEGVASDTASLDALITGAAEGWTAERLAPLERNILRVAVHEMSDRPDIPTAVSINEAVDLAKRYCQAEARGAGERHPGADCGGGGGGAGMSGDAAQRLAADAARLEEVARRLAEDEVLPGELRALADEALELSARITEGVARLVRGDEA